MSRVTDEATVTEISEEVVVIDNDMVHDDFADWRSP